MSRAWSRWISSAQRAAFSSERLISSRRHRSRSNIRSYGHLGPADVLLNLRTGLDTGEFGPGETVLVMNNSPAAAWSSALVRL